MKIKFWGTRGSIPTPGRKTEKYGGNTSCVEVRTPDDELFVCDAGSGLREFGQELLREYKDKSVKAHVFITHTHWDHIQGIPFFTPAFVKGNHFTFHGPGDIRGALHGQMTNTYFPVPLDAMGAKLDFVSVQPGIRLHFGKVSVKTAPLVHPGGAVAYRLEYKGKSVVYVTDNELSEISLEHEHLPQAVMGLSQFVKGASLLIADTQYTREEYAGKKGWGHSVVDDVIKLALRSDVKTLALFHHDPTHSDEFMEKLFHDRAKALSRDGTPMECFIAREGMAIEV